MCIISTTLILFGLGTPIVKLGNEATFPSLFHTKTLIFQVNIIFSQGFPSTKTAFLFSFSKESSKIPVSLSGAP
jgi:hypothetical protein